MATTEKLIMSEKEYLVYGGCDSCTHQNEICTNCTQMNSAGEWVHALYSPKPGVYKVSSQELKAENNR